MKHSMNNSKTLNKLQLLICVLFLTSCTMHTDKISSIANGVNIVKTNTPLAVIVIPNDDKDKTFKKPQPLWIEFQSDTFWGSSPRKSAELLSDYIFKSTSARLPVVKEQDIPPGKNEIHVGPTEYAKTLNLLVKNMDSDGFIIKIPDQKRIVLLGGSDIGTEYSVYEFLENYVGVRWLFPGELGDHVPIMDSLTVFGPEIKQEPGFYSRVFRLSRGKGGKTWCRRCRIHSRIEFHHNIPKLFDVSYTKSHPHFFPLIDGKRRLPKKSNQPTWHLCYSADGLKEETVRRIHNFFSKNPEYPSVSLGVSDGGADCFCRCEECLKKQGKTINSMGYNHYSDMYYKWGNEVVKELAKSFPDKYIGCSAYREITDPPENVNLHKNFIPYITFELLQCADPERKEIFEGNVTKWKKRAKKLGAYDYIYGPKYYYIPHVFFHLMDEYILYLFENNFIGFYAEVGSKPEDVFHTGPQMYLLARLLWNPELDVDALLKDWYTSAVGEEASEYLAEYFAIWEDYWTNRVRETEWYGKKSVLYLKFNDLGYLEKLKRSDVKRALSLLQKTVDTAGPGRQKQRAQLFLDNFRKHSAGLLYQIKMKELQNKDLEITGGKTVLRQDFSKGMNGWRTTSSKVKQKQWSSNKGREATGALQISKNNCVLNGIKVIPEKKYLMEFFVKGQDLPKDASLSMIIDWRDKNKDESKMRAYKIFRKINRKQLGNKWQKIQFVITPPNAKGIAVGHYFDMYLFIKKNKDGKIWIDDLTINEM